MAPKTKGEIPPPFATVRKEGEKEERAKRPRTELPLATKVQILDLWHKWHKKLFFPPNVTPILQPLDQV